MKKQRIEVNRTIVDDFLASFGDLIVDVLANIFGFLTVKNIMRSRRINKKSKEAVKMTIVPLSKVFLGDFRVDSMKIYNAMNVMTRAMPNLQQITIRELGYDRGNFHKYNDGEDPDEEWAAQTADFVSHDIGIISNFGKLRTLEIDHNVSLNGRYPFLFNCFPLLQKLSIRGCNNLKWDLEMLAGMPLLKELDCSSNPRLTGNISSLRVLKDTLEKVKLGDVEGNFMDLADFPRLKVLNLEGIALIGDIRDIGESDFPSLITLILPKTVYGAKGATFQRISDGPKLIKELYPLKKHHPRLSILKYWCGMLSRDSPDRYAQVDEIDVRPFYIRFVQAGSRIGYRWGTDCGSPCEVNWLDPEPDRESSDYGKYTEELREIESRVLYRGFYQPPSEEEYIRLNDSLVRGGLWWTTRGH